MEQVKPLVLVILDGFGYRKETVNNAIAQAKKPTIDFLLDTFPHTLLKASGTAVGLLQGIMGNSEVGHLTIGSGRIVQQPVSFIHEAITHKSFFKNPALTQQLQKLKQSGAPLHIMGLLSNAGVHSDLEELYAFLDAAHQHGIRHVFIHAFLDGRDAPAKSAVQFLQPLDDALTSLEYGSIGSLHGRFYAMDRDKHWDRTEKSYRVLTGQEECIPQTWETALQEQYNNKITDEFIVPIQLDPTSSIEPGDGIIFMNFRPDRARQLTAAFVDPLFNHFPVRKLNLSCFITPVNYGANLKTVVMFPEHPIQHTLKEVLEEYNKTMFSIAETEKYAHITYFFDGGREKTFNHEKRVLVPSLPERNYIHHPQMSAREITADVLKSLQTDPRDFYLINYANADMVGHSGDLQATIKAIECLDEQLKKLYETVVINMDGTLIVTADHGNAEDKYDPVAKQPRTAHTTNPVPFIIANKKLENCPEHLKLTSLADIAPYILSLMKLPIPEEMDH
ncbi:MAG TPA: 2,3-bisphosphoglycerate-independent phosphoglycerate mutase [Candidatus Babeliales bacterium]|nr:2,3-bisphosphoglycerate-independent phosphoglycerate mutase [Candidatus Babeliales bacterium]